LNSNAKLIQINARKSDNKIHRSWKCQLINQQDSLLIFVGEFAEEVKHSDLGLIKKGTVSYEYYWLDRWYNVFRFHEPEGDLRNFYCNVNMPPIFENESLDYIDLDIDVLVWKDFSYEILDLEEFESNSLRFNYSSNVIENARKSLYELIRMINQRQFPFDFTNSML
jgi:protein associated with RNAse G/E